MIYHLLILKGLFWTIFYHLTAASKNVIYHQFWRGPETMQTPGQCYKAFFFVSDATPK